MIPTFIDPRTILRLLEQIDREPPSYTSQERRNSRQIFIVLVSVTLALLMLNYLKNSSALEQLLVATAELQGRPTRYWLDKLFHTGFESLLRYSWWSSWHVLLYVILPCLVLRYCLRSPVRECGWRWGDTHKHWRGYLLLLSPILVFVIFASTRDDFVAHYPFYRDAGRSWFDLLAWEMLYLIQFASLEFFFRGYMLQSLRPHYGAGAIWIMVVPYVMIHFTKPWLEATGAIFFGLFLAILALRSRSIWGGFFVHAGVAVSMDIASLLQQGRLPEQWWPAI